MFAGFVRLDRILATAQESRFSLSWYKQNARPLDRTNLSRVMVANFQFLHANPALEVIGLQFVCRHDV